MWQEPRRALGVTPIVAPITAGARSYTWCIAHPTRVTPVSGLANLTRSPRRRHDEASQFDTSGQRVELARAEHDGRRRSGAAPDRRERIGQRMFAHRHRGGSHGSTASCRVPPARSSVIGALRGRADDQQTVHRNRAACHEGVVDGAENLDVYARRKRVAPECRNRKIG